MSTAVSIREMLEKNGDVIAAYPHGDTGSVHVLAKSAGVFTKDSIAKVIDANKKFTVKDFAVEVVAKKKDALEGKKKQPKAGSAG